MSSNSWPANMRKPWRSHAPSLSSLEVGGSSETKVNQACHVSQAWLPRGGKLDDELTEISNTSTVHVSAEEHLYTPESTSHEPEEIFQDVRIISYHKCLVQIQLMKLVQKCHQMLHKAPKAVSSDIRCCTIVADVRNLILHYSLACSSLFI
jgi:hypothetical protein